MQENLKVLGTSVLEKVNTREVVQWGAKEAMRNKGWFLFQICVWSEMTVDYIGVNVWQVVENVELESRCWG